MSVYGAFVKAKKSYTRLNWGSGLRKLTMGILVLPETCCDTDVHLKHLKYVFVRKLRDKTW